MLQAFPHSVKNLFVSGSSKVFGLILGLVLLQTLLEALEDLIAL